MIEILTESYSPKKLLHRDIQIKKISSTFKQFKEFGVGTNLVLLGFTGSGKTEVIKHLIARYGENIYISASNLRSAFQVIRKISQDKSRDYADLMELAKEKLKKEKKILIIDELNKVDNPKEFFDDLNTLYRETTIPIILITNNRKLLSYIPDDARLTLFFHYVEFPSYNALELYDILKDRLKMLPKKVTNGIPEHILRYICSNGTEEGSARDVLDFTMKCIITRNFTEKFIQELVKEKRRSEWSEFVKAFNKLERRFLDILFNLHVKGEEITNAAIQKYLTDYSPQRISQLITEFEKYGIISTKKIYKGRAGGTFRNIEVDHDMFIRLDGVLE